MNNLPHPVTATPSTARRQLLQTALLGGGFLLIPVMLATLFVAAFNALDGSR